MPVCFDAVNVMWT